MKNRLKSGIDLSKMVEDKFRKQVSVFHIQQFLKEHGLNDQRVIKNVVAGVGFILGAMNAMNGEETTLHVIKRMKDRRPDEMQIHAHKASTLLRYVRTLFFLPAIGMERPIERDSYDEKTLGALTSQDCQHVRYRSTDRFLRT
jgi:hypothetical protein